MEISHSDKNTLEFVDNAAMTFMLLETDRINGILLDSGIADRRLRQEICERLVFQSAYNYEAGLVHRRR